MKMEMGTYFIFFRKVYVTGKWLFYAFQWLSRVVSWKVFNSPFLGYNILDIFKVFGPPSDGGPMILPRDKVDEIVEAIFQHLGQKFFSRFEIFFFEIFFFEIFEIFSYQLCQGLLITSLANKGLANKG